MDEETIKALTREECILKLKEIGQHGSGSADDMRIKLRKFCLYPKLYERLRNKAQWNFKFECSLDPNVIPPISAKWDNDDSFYPIVSDKIFKEYCSFKSQGNKGQQEKAYRMLQSRKIIPVKSNIINNNKIYLKAMVKKSYGTEIRPTVILFIDSIPKKSHCRCPVGLSGLCCHVLAVLLYLRHFSDTKEKLLELNTATSKMASKIKKRFNSYGSLKRNKTNVC